MNLVTTKASLKRIDGKSNRMKLTSTSLISKVIALVVVFLPIVLRAQSGYIATYRNASTAWNKKDHASYVLTADTLLQQANHPGIMLRQAIAYAQLGNLTKTSQLLEKLIMIGATYKIDTIDSFKQRMHKGKLDLLNSRLLANAHNADRADTAFVIADKFFIPEGITADREGNFYVGSLSKWKVLKYSSGQAVELFDGKRVGLWSILGLKIRQSTNELWGCSATEVDSIRGSSALFCLNAKTGEVIKKFSLSGKSQEHFFNDLTIAPNGIVYLTDSKGGTIYRYRPGSDGIELFIDGLIYPNGITCDDEGKYLYIAEARGLFVTDINSKRLKKLNEGNNFYTVGVDGLYFHEGSLIAIQDTGFS